jgi:hypothetical protein
MAQPIDKSTEKLIREFVSLRIEYISTGNRILLDSTYELNCRNEYNCHDYNWYINLIEFGFGSEVQHYEIFHVEEETPLPFDELVTYPLPPEYVVSLTTVNQRRTCWFIRIIDDLPKVVLPAFGGKVGDAIACGEYGRKDRKQSTPIETVFRFDEDEFANELGQRIYIELSRVKLYLKYDEIRALAIDCYPYHGRINLCILTNHEDFSEEHGDFPEEQCGKWSMAEWRYYDFSSTVDAKWPFAKDLMEQMTKYYESGADGTATFRADKIYRACAKALCSSTVSKALKLYKFNLASDFEFGVFDPDRYPKKENYCDRL